MQAPRSKKELQSFFGMVNFLRKFSPNLSETSKLRYLPKSDLWLWSDEHNEQFNAIKRLITA